MVTSRTPGDSVERLSVSKRDLEQGRGLPASEPESDVITLVGSGTIVGDQQVLIVDPETRRPCLSGRIGEVWIQGPSVTRGYWNRPELSAESLRLGRLMPPRARSSPATWAYSTAANCISPAGSRN